MPYAEFAHHVVYHRLYPWGDEWKQAQAIAAAVISASPKYKRINLGPYFPKPPSQSADYIFGFFKQLAIDAEARRKMNGNQRL